jgi:murein tripeptide amidase MpaA
VIKIGAQTDANKPIVWIDGCIHAREWISCSTACYIIRQLIDEYNANDEQTKYLLDKFDFYILPVTNPDGYEFSRTEVRYFSNYHWIIKNKFQLIMFI